MVAIDGAVFNRDDLGSAVDDATLVCDLYRAHGFAGAIERLNGDFAIAVYDEAVKTLWLARDRFGVKPLYYAAAGAQLAFASRPRALLTLSWVSSQVNAKFVARFAGLHYRYFDNRPDESAYACISQLPAAHILRYANGSIAVSEYWKLDQQPDWTEPESDLAERYRELLHDAVRLRTARSRRRAFTLSGGMDSSSVLASAVKQTGCPQHALSAVYTDPTYDESADIASMLDSAVEQWHPIAIDQPDVFGLVRQMVALHDEPVATATWLSHYLLCQHAAAGGFDVILGGLGGDEVNAGEYEHFIYHFADLRQAGDEGRLARDIAGWVAYHDHPVFRKSANVAEAALARLVDSSAPGVCRLDRPRFERYIDAVRPEYCDLRELTPVMDHPFTSYLKNRTYQDLTRETIPCCLRAEDRQFEAFGLEHRLPFLDHRLVEFMFRVPGTMKFRDGVSKHLLRVAMRSVLPEETRMRIKKTGWNAPAHRWFSGAGRQALLDLVHSKAFVERGIYNQPYVCELIAEHQRIVTSGETSDNHMMFLWQLVNLELWLQDLSA